MTGSPTPLDYITPQRERRRERSPWSTWQLARIAIYLLALIALLDGLLIPWPITKGMMVPARVRVIDSVTGKPLVGATVEMLTIAGTHYGVPPLVAGSSGAVTMKIFVGGGWRHRIILDEARYGDESPRIIVTATGYESRTVATGRGHTWRVCWMGPSPRFDLEVKLTPTATTKNSSTKS